MSTSVSYVGAPHVIRWAEARSCAVQLVVMTRRKHFTGRSVWPSEGPSRLEYNVMNGGFQERTGCGIIVIVLQIETHLHGKLVEVTHET